jgi:hypothetical protein
MELDSLILQPVFFEPLGLLGRTRKRKDALAA